MKDSTRYEGIAVLAFTVSVLMIGVAAAFIHWIALFLWVGICAGFVGIGAAIVSSEEKKKENQESKTDVK